MRSSSLRFIALHTGLYSKPHPSKTAQRFHPSGVNPSEVHEARAFLADRVGKFTLQRVQSNGRFSFQADGEIDLFWRLTRVDGAGGDRVAPSVLLRRKHSPRRVHEVEARPRSSRQMGHRVPADRRQRPSRLPARLRRLLRSRPLPSHRRWHLRYPWRPPLPPLRRADLRANRSSNLAEISPASLTGSVGSCVRCSKISCLLNPSMITLPGLILLHLQRPDRRGFLNPQGASFCESIQ